MSTITKQGIIPKTLSEYEQDLRKKYLDIDNEWRITSNTPDGQHIISISALLSQLDQEQIKTYNARDPRQAENAALDDLAAHQDIERETSRQSKIDLELTGVLGTAVYKNTQIRNKSTLTIWSLLEDSTVGLFATFRSLEYGYVSADENDPGQFEIVNPSVGFGGITNPKNYLIGRNNETNEQLRKRRKSVVSRPSIALQDSIAAAIFSIRDVVDCDVIDYIEEPEQESKIEVVVLGGDEAEIAKAIYQKRSQGCRTVGLIELNVQTARAGRTFPIRFNRPALKNVNVKISIVGGVQISQNLKNATKDEIIAYSLGEVSLPYAMNNSGFKIGENPPASSIYSAVNAVLGDTISRNDQVYIDSIELSVDSGSTWSKFAQIGRAEISSFNDSLIEFVNL